MISKASILLILVALGSSLHTQHEQTTAVKDLTFPQVISGLETLQQRAANNTDYSKRIVQPNELIAYLEKVLNSEVRDLYMF